MRAIEALKFAVYRTPVVSRLMAPRYPYKIDPAQLAAMIGFIDATQDSGAAVLEIGVAQGDTSVFLLEHMRTTRDPRPLLLFDTFAGFTPDSVAHEIRTRGKRAEDIVRFRYGDETRFKRNIRNAGYANFRTVKGDVALFDWASIAPIGAVLLDVDLYRPTRAVLEAIWPHVVSEGGIVLDDCRSGTPWDGSLQAYEEFIAAHGLAFERIGGKGAVIRAQGVS